MEIINYEYNLNIVEKSSTFLNTNSFSPQKINKKYPFYLGINAFDVFILEKFIEHFNIKSVLELGCGSSSKIFDILGVARKSYALAYPDEPVSFTMKDLEKDMKDLIIDLPAVDMLFIDCDHSYKFAEKYSKLLLSSFNGLIFIHDWFLPSEEAWPEQHFHIDSSLLSKYENYTISRHYCKELFEGSNIVPCSIFLWNRMEKIT